MHNIHRTEEENWADRGIAALRFCTLLTVIAVIAVGISGMHPMVPVTHPDMATAAAPASDAKPYYFPSEYELNAPADSGEAAPTF